MDKLDLYGDNFRNVPICVPNETESDALAFKELIANKRVNIPPYLHEGSLDTTETNQRSLLPGADTNSNWRRNFEESGEAWSSLLMHGHKKTKKLKKQKKEAKG